MADPVPLSLARLHLAEPPRRRTSAWAMLGAALLAAGAGVSVPAAVFVAAAAPAAVSRPWTPPRRRAADPPERTTPGRAP